MAYPKVLISLASYPPRIMHAYRSIETLLHQTISADEIHLNLAVNDFKDEHSELMGVIEEIGSSGVVVDWHAENLRPHNKYYWIMKSHPDDIVITVDDDVLYPSTLVQTLLEEHYRHPDAVIANRTHIVLADESGKLLPYKDWLMEQTRDFGECRSDLIATGVGGILYPPSVFDEEVFDRGSIADFALLADDLWLMVHEARLGVSVVNTSVSPRPCYVPGSQEQGLYVENLENGRNDRILTELFKLYPEVAAKIAESAERRVPTIDPTKEDGLIKRIVKCLRNEK